MPRKWHTLAKLTLAIAATALLAACDAQPTGDPMANGSDDPMPRPRRAVQSPIGIASPNSEVLGGPQGAIPLVTVDFPNHKNEPTVVHTIGDSLTPKSPFAPTTQKAATTAPANGEPTPAAAVPTAEGAAEPAIAAPIRIVDKKVAEDTLVATKSGEKVTLSVTSQSGIGSAVLERTADTWPATISVRFAHGAHPFEHLEGFSATELTDAGGKVPLKVEVNKQAATAVITIPGFARSSHISIEWVDQYR